MVFWIGAFSNAFVGGVAADDSWSGLCGSLNGLVGLPGCGLVRRRRVFVVVPLVLQPSNAGSSSNAENLSQIALTLWVKPISDGSLPLAVTEPTGELSPEGRKPISDSAHPMGETHL